MRRPARVILTLLMIASLGFGAVNLWTLWRSPAGAWLVDRTEQEAKVRLERLLAREATPERIGARLTVLLSETPRDWAAIDALKTLAREQEVILQDEVRVVLDQAHEEDRTWIIVVGKCLSCAWNSANCDLSGIVLCNVTVSLTPLGDLASVIRESGHYVTGAPVDDIDLALSAIGLGAVAIVPLTGGSSLLIKTGASMAKTAYRIGVLSAPVLAATGARREPASTGGASPRRDLPPSPATWPAPSTLKRSRPPWRILARSERSRRRPMSSTRSGWLAASTI